MLKWTVTKRSEMNSNSARLQPARKSLGALSDQMMIVSGEVDNETATNIKTEGRRSLGMIVHCHAQFDKENECITSTPQLAAARTSTSPYSMVLRDVSNITPNSTPCRSMKLTVRSRKRTAAASSILEPKLGGSYRNTTARETYATTLPSFDVEYSPYGMKNVPFLALRGVGLTDFNKPGRYFHDRIDDGASKKLKLEKNHEEIARPPVQLSLPFPCTPLSSRNNHTPINGMDFQLTSSVSKTIYNNHIYVPETVHENELSFNSSEMGDITLEKMIDAILASAKKDMKSVTPRPKRTLSNKSKQSKGSSPTYTAADDPATDLYVLEQRLPQQSKRDSKKAMTNVEENGQVNEREIKTPESNNCNPSEQQTAEEFERKSLKRMDASSPLEFPACHLRRQKAVRRKHKTDAAPAATCCPSFSDHSDNIVKNLSNVPESPCTPQMLCSHSKTEQMILLETPISTVLKSVVNSDLQFRQEETSSNVTPRIRSIDLQGSSTPTVSFNSKKTLEISTKGLGYSPETTPETRKVGHNDSLQRRRSSSALTEFQVRGTLELNIRLDAYGRLLVHVIRCTDLQRTNGSTLECNTINAYVKVTLVNSVVTTQVEQVFQRTAVHRNSSRPHFDQRFYLDVLPNDERRVQLTVWHRNRECKRSEFLGCMCFPVKNAISKEIYGSYRLQTQACLANPSAPISDIMCEISQSSVDEIVSMEDVSSSAIAAAPSGTSATGTVTIGSTACCADSSIELSKKAIEQRDADENLFLRFLELDPSPDGVQSSGSLPISTTPRRTSICSGKPTNCAGRTPFTITKRLVRSGDRGYGFSIVWTHPPRVEKIEQGLSAEKAGILPGDYVVFVEKHNVVTMPEQDVLNLIKTQGNTLLLEIFRRPLQITAQQQQKHHLGNDLRNSTVDIACPTTTTSSSGNLLNFTPYHMANNTMLALDESELFLKTTPCGAERASTACSNFSVETAKRKLHLPQVTFSKESIVHQFTDHRRKLLHQLINREQHFINAINFGIERFVNPLRERKDLISSNDHKTLFQNIDELSRISEDILEQVIQNETEFRIHFASRVYLSKSTAICVAYRKYCNGLKKADCVLVNKSRNSNCDFMKFITEPPVPRKRPDLTTFIHRPLQHFREILKHMQMIASHCRVDSEEQMNFNSIINELQTSYREITVGGGLMEPIGEGRPLLTLQDLEARMVFTKCKPFQLVTHGRQWIFGGDLSRVEGRSVKPYWTLLFSDILLFAKVSRDRVLFITEEPISLSTVTDSCFNIRKKGTEFRLTIDPSGRQIESPTVHCAPDLTRTPSKKNLKRRYVVLRAPSTELKAVWQNLLTRQIFLVNATLGCTPLSSPLDSPDILQSLVPADIGATVTSIASGNISSLDNVHQANNQARLNAMPKQVEELIDEQCRKLNKTGVPQGGALHLAQWMKGQLDKQVIESDPIDSDSEQQVEEWTIEKVKNRSKELNLVDSNGSLPRFLTNTKVNSAEQLPADEISMFEDDEDKSFSKSTTSDSQVTVRSSPLSNKLDTLSVCRECHKRCKTRISSRSNNSLKVQHSQSTPSNPCCVSNSTTASSLIKCANSLSSMSSSSTLTLHGASGQEYESKFTEPLQHPITEKSSYITSNCTATHKNAKLGLNLKLTNSEVGNYHIPCHCKCTPKDFENCTLSPDQLLHEQVKILNFGEINANVSNAQNTCRENEVLLTGTKSQNANFANFISESSKETIKNKQDTDCSFKGFFEQINGVSSIAAKLDPFETLPTIAVMPPTPDVVQRQNMHLTSVHYENYGKQLRTHAVDQCIERTISDEYSPDNSPEDEIVEPPYRALNASLKRYGTVSSLERVPSEDTDDNKTYNSSEEDSDYEIKIVTKEVFDNNEQTAKNWTTRAGNFIEESRAFIDRYLGHVARNMNTTDVEDNGNHEQPRDKSTEHSTGCGEAEEEEIVEGETSATSGEEVWGTPTSGGENDDMQIFGSIEQTHSSPTKSSSSYTGDDDTELMMDELLMAPPMTASAVRGLLPRRKLEPLFEEESESYESDDDCNPIRGHENQGQASERSPQVYLDSRNSNGSGSVSTTPPSTPRAEVVETIKTTTPDGSCGNVADRCYASAQLPNSTMPSANDIEHSEDRARIGFSPRIEMRLALNHDILGDEDLLPYSSGPDLTAILGCDLSKYHRMNGKDIIMNQIVTRMRSFRNIRTVADQLSTQTQEPHTSNSARRSLQIMKNETSSSYQQNNSKMDTPIPNRRTNIVQATWNNFGSADRGEKTLSDLERLARREKVYCMSQLNQNTSQLKHTASFNSKKKNSNFFNFLSRRHSEYQLVRLFSTRHESHDITSYNSDRSRSYSPNKESDKPLDRRFWKQLNRRRRLSFQDVAESM
ncbi:uncharacterized protein LOC126575807 [Anopheles aquasalis]|uniref:uncharacterized protein LOC126575807 n=1 Tax=Anopheles aquasalis TaxID=42839 RepID=UPI00215A4102|nr:uncharacterized protein LOC126575807 [Anopheles aquasalis]